MGEAHPGKMWHGGWRSCGAGGKDNSYDPNKKPAQPRPNKVQQLPAELYQSEEEERPAPIDENRLAELKGLCQGILADGRVVLTEAEYLRDWLGDVEDLDSIGVGRSFLGLLQEFLEDGILDKEEESTLIGLLRHV